MYVYSYLGAHLHTSPIENMREIKIQTRTCAVREVCSGGWIDRFTIARLSECDVEWRDLFTSERASCGMEMFKRKCDIKYLHNLTYGIHIEYLWDYIVRHLHILNDVSKNILHMYCMTNI